MVLSKENIRIVSGVPPRLPKNTFVAIDTEWFGVDQKRVHRPNSGTFALMTVCFQDGVVYVIDNEGDIREALSNLSDAIWVIQDSKFDITHLRKLVGIKPRRKLWDTLLIDKILWGGYYDNFSLKHMARRYLGMILDKSVRERFNTGSSLSDEMIWYACVDAIVCYRIFREQYKNWDDRVKRVWEVDRNALWAILDFSGFRIDFDRWLEVSRENKNRQFQIESQLPVNPRSSKKLLDFLRVNGFHGLSDTREDTLTKFIERHPNTRAAEISRMVLEARKYSKLVSTYGENFEDFIENENGYYVIYADYNVIGARTGRTSCSNPNMQNIPARDGKDLRSCFIPRPGNSLIIADYSSQEPAIMAFLSGDENLIKIFTSGKDIYSEVASKVFGKTVTKGDPERQTIKGLILGIDYGMTPKGLADRQGITVDEARGMIQKFFSLFPGVKAWMDRQREQEEYVETVIGRRFWLNPYSRHSDNNSLNAPIQGTAADMMKYALWRIYDKWPFDYPFSCVGYVHDEVIFDVPTEIADEVSRFVKEEMIAAANEMCPGVGFKADCIIGKSWGDK